MKEVVLHFLKTVFNLNWKKFAIVGFYLELVDPEHFLFVHVFSFKLLESTLHCDVRYVSAFFFSETYKPVPMKAKIINIPPNEKKKIAAWVSFAIFFFFFLFFLIFLNFSIYILIIFLFILSKKKKKIKKKDKIKRY